MSEFFEISQRERELYAAMEAASAKRDEIGRDLYYVILGHGPEGSAAEDEARRKLGDAIRETAAAMSAWAKVYKARKALQVAATEAA